MFLMSCHWRKFCLTSKELGKLSNLCEKHCVRHCHFAKTCFFFSILFFFIYFFFNKRVIFLPLGGNERCLKLQVKIAGLERHWRLKLISLGNYKCNLSRAALSFSLFQNHHAASETTPCRLLFWRTKLWKLIGVKKWLKPRMSVRRAAFRSCGLTRLLTMFTCVKSLSAGRFSYHAKRPEPHHISLLSGSVGPPLGGGFLGTVDVAAEGQHSCLRSLWASSGFTDKDARKRKCPLSSSWGPTLADVCRRHWKQHFHGPLIY